MANQISIDQLLSHLELFTEVSDEDRHELARNALLVRVRKSEHVFKRGVHATGLYVAITGQIKVSIPGTEQRDKVIEFFGPGQQFGEAVMFLNHPYMSDAQAIEDALLIWISHKAISTLMSTNTLFMTRIVKGLAQRFETLLHDIEIVNLHSATERLADYILRHADQKTELYLTLPKRTIASKLGLQPETLSRAFHQLCEENCIEVANNKVSITNQSALEKYAPKNPVVRPTGVDHCDSPQDLSPPHKSLPAHDSTNSTFSKYSVNEF
ncbi:Crp/Fnr family transcriptional regulator [Zwartia sp.]|uniref:Crp/Fnr family transcriptional regulator n=1 Tax=Zwartia sp. TaxID=2978004 RepID=UPI0027160DFB|nr:Crp/Fnr family transcriptional regulator [Zwartia sp.]MDO9026026.1 Crp/Fnr family transcriptional regulator [Zwartia sp.]